MNNTCKIFNLSFPRCGTSSLHVFFQTIGLRSQHVDLQLRDSFVYGRALDWHNVDANDASGDTPFSLRPIYRACMERYPRSRFIFCTRPLGDWLRSIEALWKFNCCKYVPRVGRWRTTPIGQEDAMLHQQMYGSANFHAEKWGNAYTRTMYKIAEDFADKPGKLLVLDLQEPDQTKADKLREFLSYPLPAAFPRLNVRSVGASRIW